MKILLKFKKRIPLPYEKLTITARYIYGRGQGGGYHIASPPGRRDGGGLI